MYLSQMCSNNSKNFETREEMHATRRTSQIPTEKCFTCMTHYHRNHNSIWTRSGINP